jgi:predicted nucleic acid-binding protein
MLLVDTNIVAYLLIDGDFSEAAQRLRKSDSDWRSEAFLMTEFTNVLAASIAVRRMTLPLAEDFLSKANTLLENKLTRVADTAALAIAVRFRVSAYDARFLALADQIGIRLVTQDAKLRAAAPKLTQSLAEALANAR